MALLGKPLHHLPQSYSLLSPRNGIRDSLTPSHIAAYNRSRLTNQLFSSAQQVFKIKSKRRNGGTMARTLLQLLSLQGRTLRRTETFQGLNTYVRPADYNFIRSSEGDIWKYESNTNAINGHLLKGVPELWQWQSEGTDYDGTTQECICLSYQLLSLQLPGENTQKKSSLWCGSSQADLALPSGAHTVRKAKSHLQQFFG